LPTNPPAEWSTFRPTNKATIIPAKLPAILSANSTTILQSVYATDISTVKLSNIAAQQHPHHAAIDPAQFTTKCTTYTATQHPTNWATHEGTINATFICPNTTAKLSTVAPTDMSAIYPTVFSPISSTYNTTINATNKPAK
jgi:hypothetical protein